MAHKPTYAELEQGLKELEQEALERRRAEEALLSFFSFPKQLWRREQVR